MTVTDWIKNILFENLKDFWKTAHQKCFLIIFWNRLSNSQTAECIDFGMLNRREIIKK